MAGNSFATEHGDGTHVGGSVVMALNAKGEAFPVGEDTPIGAVKVTGLPFTFEQFCRALAAHAVFIRDPGNLGMMEDAFRQIRGFALAEPGFVPPPPNEEPQP